MMPWDISGFVSDWGRVLCWAAGAVLLGVLFVVATSFWVLDGML